MVHIGKVKGGCRRASLHDRSSVQAVIGRIHALSEKIADSPVKISIRELRDEGRL